MAETVKITRKDKPYLFTVLSWVAKAVTMKVVTGGIYPVPLAVIRVNKGVALGISEGRMHIVSLPERGGIEDGFHKIGKNNASSIELTKIPEKDLSTDWPDWRNAIPSAEEFKKGKEVPLLKYSAPEVEYAVMVKAMPKEHSISFPQFVDAYAFDDMRVYLLPGEGRHALPVCFISKKKRAYVMPFLVREQQPLCKDDIPF